MYRFGLCLIFWAAMTIPSVYGQNEYCAIGEQSIRQMEHDIETYESYALDALEIMDASGFWYWQNEIDQLNLTIRQLERAMEGEGCR